MNLNPLDLPGPAFLAFYSFALIAAHFLGKVLIRWCQSTHVESGVLPDQLPPSEAAFLAGGTERAVDTALVRLLHAKMILVKPGGDGFEIDGKKTASAPLGELQSDVYREISRKNGGIDVLHRLKSAFLTRTQARLANDGLLLQGGSAEATCVRGAQTLPFAAVIAIGVVRIFVGIARHRPVTFLIVFVAASLIILAVKFFKLQVTARSSADFERPKMIQIRNMAQRISMVELLDCSVTAR